MTILNRIVTDMSAQNGWTCADILKLMDDGLLGEDEKFELRVHCIFPAIRCLSLISPSGHGIFQRRKSAEPLFFLSLKSPAAV